ncbi:MAG TPA: thioredoxin domain-containing protein, partial [Solirubrobacteraceae bacterium]|nr:thioredoxin domain-containing protein [Solirubrobacteraceae bacterium]
MSRVEIDEELTRKQRREHARSERKAIEEASAADAARRRRLTRLGVVVAVVVAAVVVILLATSSGSSTQKHGTKGAEKVEREVSSLLAGIDQSGNSLGSPTAPVTLQYFGDLECSICRKFTLGALPSLIQHQVREGKLRIEYHNLETATHEPETFKTQQAAALSAGQQAKLWNFIETFYHEQGQEGSDYVTEEWLRNIAEQVPGLDVAKWTSERT